MNCADTRSYAALGGRLLAQVGVRPLDPVGDLGPGVGRVRGGPLQRGGGDVDRGDLPAPLGEPDRVGALAAADVQRPPGRQVR